MSETRELQMALVHTEALRIFQYEEAYPDVGWGPDMRTCTVQAIANLKAQGLLPEDWEPRHDG